MPKLRMFSNKPKTTKKMRRRSFPSSSSKPRVNMNNACEVILMDMPNRAYGELIEARVKSLDISVDLLFVKDETFLVRTLDDLSRRGTWYAMVVTPPNEAYGSVTLYVMYGAPEEHRNMPLEDALKLMASCYADHICNKSRGNRRMSSDAFEDERDVRRICGLLANCKEVSIAELEMVANSLKARIDQMAISNGTSSTTTTDAEHISTKNLSDSAQKEKELHRRLMTIMNQEGEIWRTLLSTTSPHEPSNTGSPEITNLSPDEQQLKHDSSDPIQPSICISLDNPEVRKAVDSLTRDRGFLNTLTAGGNSWRPLESRQKVHGTDSKTEIIGKEHPRSGRVGNPEGRSCFDMMDDRSPGPFDVHEEFDDIRSYYSMRNRGFRRMPNVRMRRPPPMFGFRGRGSDRYHPYYRGYRQPYIPMWDPLGY